MVTFVIAALTMAGAVLLAVYAKKELDRLNGKIKVMEAINREALTALGEKEKAAKETSVSLKALGDRVEAMEGILADLDVTAETAVKAREQMQRFSEGVASILNYDGGGKE